MRLIVAAVAAALTAAMCAPAARADELTCNYTGIPIIVALTGPVVFVCGDGGVTVNHTTNTQVDPSLFGHSPQLP